MSTVVPVSFPDPGFLVEVSSGAFRIVTRPSYASGLMRCQHEFIVWGGPGAVALQPHTITQTMPDMS